MTNTGMRNHMLKKHADIALSQSQEPQSANDNPTSIPVSSTSKKRESTVSIYTMCTKKQRQNMFQQTIPDWVESKTMLKFHDPRALRIHKSILEFMLTDKEPFYAVRKPGFLRLMQTVAPNFEVASDKYYREQLETTYDGIKSGISYSLYQIMPSTSQTLIFDADLCRNHIFSL